MVLSTSLCLLVLVSVSVLFSTSVCLDDISLVVTYWERAAHSVIDVVILVISHYGFEGGSLVLIASVLCHCLSFAFYTRHDSSIQITSLHNV